MPVNLRYIEVEVGDHGFRPTLEKARLYLKNKQSKKG
jgi:hypothetical protein